MGEEDEGYGMSRIGQAVGVVAVFLIMFPLLELIGLWALPVLFVIYFLVDAVVSGLLGELEED